MRMFGLAFYAGLGFAAVFLSPGLARADVLQHPTGEVVDTLDARMDQPLPKNSELKIGFGPVIKTALDSGRNRFYPLPLIFYRYKEYLSIDEAEVRVNVFANESAAAKAGFRAGPMLNIDFGNRMPFTRGVKEAGKVGTSIEVGGFASYRYGPASVRVRARQDIFGGHGGTVVNLDLRSGFYRGHGVSLAAQVATTWGSQKYMQSNFGVTAAQAGPAGLPIYTPKAGFRDITPSLVGEYKFNDHWATTATVQFVRRIGDVGDSPIVDRRGTADRILSGVFVMYTF